MITGEMFTDKMNILIYGDPGSGKTHLSGTAQDSEYMKNVHVLNIDGGLLTLAYRGDISATDIGSVEDLEAELFKIVNRDEKYKGIKTIIIDNISELQTLGLEGIVEVERVKRVKKDKNYSIDEIYLEDYGILTKRLPRILRGFRDLPMHIIYIAHRKDKIRKGTQVLEESKPNLTEKICSAVVGYMDFVWYLYTADEVVGSGENAYAQTHRYLLTQPLNCFMAKTRGTNFAQALGSVVRDPNFRDIMEIYASKK